MGLSKMGISTLLVFVMFMISIQQGVMAFKEVKIGGDHAWSVPDGNDTDFYKDWAASIRFHVGDSLRFEYKNDSVLVVDKYGYYHCDQSKATSSYNDGNTIIKIEHPEPLYFISGTTDHCRAGQRLEVDVRVLHPHHMATPPEAHGETYAPAPSPAHESSGLKLAPILQVSSVLALLIALLV